MSSDFTLTVEAPVVARALEEYLRAPRGDAPDVVGAAKHHNALPLWKDFVGCIALQPSGQLVFWAWDNPDKLDTVGAAGEHDRRMVHAARAQGSRRFPSIAGLAPVRGENAHVCTSCGGSGQLRDMPSNLVCQCGGLGWVPW